MLLAGTATKSALFGIASGRATPRAGDLERSATGVRVDNFNKDSVTQTLQQHGLKPDENWQYGYYVKDPDGVNVQLL